jgi:Na+/proline symporter
VAYASREVEFIMNWAFSLNGLTSGAMLGGLLLALFWRKGSGAAVITGMLCSLGVMLYVSIAWKTHVAWPWYALTGTLVTLVVAWATNLFIAKPSRPGANS